MIYNLFSALMTKIKMRDVRQNILTPGVSLWLSLMLTSGSASIASDSSLDKGKAVEENYGTPRRLRLLTTQQYINTIQYYFGPDIRVDAKFAPLTRTDGLLTAGSAVAGVSDAQVETYRKVALAVAEQVLSRDRRETLVPCKPKSDSAADDVCAAKFLNGVAGYFYRGPLPAERLNELVHEAGKWANQFQDFYAGLQVTLEGILLSSNVVLVAETGIEDSKNTEKTQLDPLSFATRLSLFLWNAAPDPALRELAINGQLDSPAGRSRAVDKMLTSPRLEAGVRALFDDMFAFDDFETTAKDVAVYPYFVADAIHDAREQTLRTVIDHLLTKNLDYRDLYTTRETFLSPSLGLLYGVPVAPGWNAFTFPADAHRDGVVTHVSFLALHAHPGRSSATLRGKALRELLLCQRVPPPPANVDFSIVNNPKSNYRTARERLAAHRENPVCAGCHKITDPMGLALENFDGAGKYRTAEGGVEIDASGSLDGKEFPDVDGLSRALRDHPALSSCLVRRSLTYATGGTLPRSSEPAVAILTKTFASEGYHLRALLKAIVLSSAFSEVADPAKPAEPAKSTALQVKSFLAAKLD